MFELITVNCLEDKQGHFHLHGSHNIRVTVEGMRFNINGRLQRLHDKIFIANRNGLKSLLGCRTNANTTCCVEWLAIMWQWWRTEGAMGDRWAAGLGRPQRLRSHTYLFSLGTVRSWLACRRGGVFPSDGSSSADFGLCCSALAGLSGQTGLRLC